MFSHVMVGADDVQAAKQFYDATLAVLGHKPGRIDDKGRCFYYERSGILAISKPINGEPASHGNGSTLGFAAADQAQVDAWHAAGLANGGTAIEDPPGIREGAGVRLYLAYLRDPAGNKVCAMHRLP